MEVITFFAVGNQNRNDGTLNNVGMNGYYWTSSPYGTTNGNQLNFNSSNVNLTNNNRANGYGLRCSQETKI